MAKRLWFYLLALIIVIGLLAYWDWRNGHIEASAARTVDSSAQTVKADLSGFLNKQTDGPKLIGLARRLQKNDPSLVQPIVEKAYELAPTNPDAVLLASAYHPELKTTALELNPLIDQTINPAAPLGQLR